MKPFFVFLSLLFITLSAHANDRFVEHQNWQTFETEHFRVHFTPEYRDWAISAANELEKARTLIKQQQGRVVKEKVDAVVFDPFNGANGYAIPLENKPFTGLYATPPQSDSIISNSSSWQQLLVLHEYVHLVHLVQPERNYWTSQLGKIWDIYDITSIDTPRWAIEGYATLLESKTSSRGRLFNNQVEAILQQFAREGAMPTYSQLSQTEGRYLAGSMAYLVGARYLFWLEQNYSEQTLDNVWPRLRAKKSRDFDEAFTGIFGKPPQKLYQRFVAEYTANAIVSEKPDTTSDPKLWLNIEDGASAPVISPNSELLALVQRNSDGHVSLNIYSTEGNEQAKKDFEKQQQELIDNDPQDVADNAPFVFNPERKHRLFEKNYLRIANPRWLSNEEIIFNTSTSNQDGELHQDIAKWNIVSGQVTQLSRGKNLRRFDIVKYTNTLIAERNKFGKSQLVKFDLATNKLTELTQATLNIVYDFPRVNPVDANQLAYVSTELNESWQLNIIELDTGKGKTVPAPSGYQFLSYPSWSPDGKQLYFVAGLNNELSVYKYTLNTSSLQQITNGKQVVGWPTVTDNELYVLSTNSEGPDLYKLELDNADIATVHSTTTSAKLANVFNYPYQLSPAVYDLQQNGIESRPYGLGPQEVTMKLGTSFNSSSFDLLEVGARGGDVLQRLTWQINASQSINRKGLSGFSASARWQGWPVKISAHVFDLSLNSFKQRDPVFLNEQNLSGGMISLAYPWQRETLKVKPYTRIARVTGDNNQTSVELGIEQSWFYNKRVWGVYQTSNLSWLDGETDKLNKQHLTQTLSWDGYDAFLTLGGEFQQINLAASIRMNKRNDSDLALISLGGYGSALFNKHAQVNRQFAPELGFNSYSSNDIQYSELASWYGNMPLKVIYGTYSLANQNDIDVYGVKGGISFNMEVLGASDLIIDYGVLQVEPEQLSSELEAWVGMSYQF